MRKIIVLVSCGILILLAPYALSTSAGASFLSRIIPSISIENPTFRWLGPQRFSRLTIATSQGSVVCSQVTVNASLIEITMKSIGETSIDQAYMKVVAQKKEAPSSSGFTGSIRIGSLLVDAQDLSFRTGELQLSQSSRSKSLRFSGEISSGPSSGTISLDAVIPSDLFSSRPLSLSVFMQSMPTKILDALASFSSSEIVPSTLFGKEVTMSMDGERQRDEIDLSFSIKSERLTTAANVGVTKQMISLRAPASCQCIIAPENAPFPLDAPVSTTIALSQCMIPLHGNQAKWKEGSYDGSISVYGLRTTLPKLKSPFYVHSGTVSVRSDSLHKRASLTVSAQTDFEKRYASTIKGSAIVRNLFDDWSVDAGSIDAQTIPTALITEMTEKPFSTYLGDVLSVSATLENRLLSGYASCSLGELEGVQIETGDIWRLRKPATITYRLPSKPIPTEFNLPTVTATIKSGEMPPNDFERASAEITFSSTPVYHDPKPHGFVYKNVTGSLSLQPQVSYTFSGKATVQYTTQSAPYASLLPVPTPLTLEGNGQGDIANVSLSVDGPTLKGTLNGIVHRDKLLMENKSSLSFRPALQVLNGYLTKTTPDTPLVREVSWIDCTFDPGNIKELRGSFSIDALTLETQSLTRPSKLSGLSGRFSQNHGYSCELDCQIGNGSLSIKYDGSKEHDFRTSGKDVPTSLLDTVLNPKQSYVSLLGPEFTFQAAFAGQAICDEASITLTSQNIQSNVALSRLDRVYEMRRGSTVSITLTPRGYSAAVEPTSPIRLAKDAKITLSIGSLTFPARSEGFFPPLSDALNPESISASLSIPSMQFMNTHTNESIVINKGKGKLHRKTTGSPLSFSVRSGVGSGTIDMSGTLSNYRADNGRYSLANADIAAKGYMDKIPSLTFDALFGGNLSALFGKTLSMEYSADVVDGKGPISMDINSQTFTTKIKGRAIDGMFFLTAPLDAKLILTPELSDTLFTSLDVEIVSVNAPIHLHVDPLGFAVPLYPFSLTEGTIPKGSLDLGRLVAFNRGSPAVVGSLFDITSDSRIDMWFAPMDFRIRNGYLFIERTEILYDNKLDIATWGTIDLVKRYADLTIGLTAQSLQQTLALRLPKDYVLQVPFRGPLNNVQIDKGAAAAKIAFLVAREQGKKSDNIYGQLFGIVGDLADNQKDVPPPKRPFPWERARR